jgi:hypothetical protein
MENGEVQYNRRQKLILKKEIEKLDYAEYCELFKIIVKQTDKFTINKGGVFFNMKNLNNDTLAQIQRFIEFSKENKKMLETPRDIRDVPAPTPAPVMSRAEPANIEVDYEKFSADMESIESEDDENDVMKNFMANKTKTVGYDDNFKFSNYIEKLQTANNKKFADSVMNEIVLKPSKLKLSGVKARLMKRCRDMVIERVVAPSISIDDSDRQTKKLVKKVKTEEEIIMELNEGSDDESEAEVEESFETL